MTHMLHVTYESVKSHTFQLTLPTESLNFALVWLWSTVVAAFVVMLQIRLVCFNSL